MGSSWLISGFHPEHCCANTSCSIKWLINHLPFLLFGCASCERSRTANSIKSPQVNWLTVPYTPIRSTQIRPYAPTQWKAATICLERFILFISPVFFSARKLGVCHRLDLLCVPLCKACCEKDPKKKHVLVN